MSNRKRVSSQEKAMNDTFAKALGKTVDNGTMLTENGAVMFRTSSNKLVDCNFALASFRNRTEAEIVKDFSDAYYQDKEYAVRWLFMARDCREGSGERRTFRVLLKWLSSVDPESVRKLIPAAAEYGRFDDLFCLFGTDLEKDVISYIDRTLSSDVENMKDGRPVTLLAKWLKSPNTSSPESRSVAKKTYRALGLSEREYRRTLSALRKHIDVVEVKASAGKWSEIDYEKVPSVANIKYGKAFLRNDERRRREYLEKLATGGAKINASVCFPSDIAYQYLKNSTGWRVDLKADQRLESMWKALPQIGCDGMNVITVIDTSGSMSWQTCSQSSAVRPLDVAFALGVYCSEHLKGPFKDKCVTFSDSPEYIDLAGCGTLCEKLSVLSRSNVGGGTNVEAVMDLLLRTAVDNGIAQDDIPAVVILSDMGFNPYWMGGGTDGYDADKTALFVRIQKKYEAAGYALPKIFFWNLNCRQQNQGVPIQRSPSGIGLVSGYSQNTVKMLLSDRLDPWEILKEQLDSPRYARISEILNGVPR